MRSQVGKMAPWLITVWSPIETRCCYDFNFVTSPACDWVIDCAVWTGLSKWFDNTQQAVTENLRVLDWKTRQLLENLRLPHVLEKGNCMLILYPGPILNYTLYCKEEFLKNPLNKREVNTFVKETCLSVIIPVYLRQDSWILRFFSSPGTRSGYLTDGLPYLWLICSYLKSVFFILPTNSSQMVEKDSEKMYGLLSGLAAVINNVRYLSKHARIIFRYTTKSNNTC